MHGVRIRKCFVGVFVFLFIAVMLLVHPIVCVCAMVTAHRIIINNSIVVYRRATTSCHTIIYSATNQIPHLKHFICTMKTCTPSQAV